MSFDPDLDAVAGLIAHALNSLPDPEHGDPPCCASECAPCAALKHLHETDRLSDWVRPYVARSSDQDEPGWDWWQGSVASGGVRWEWVTARMCVNPAQCLAPLHCLAHPPESERSVKTRTVVGDVRLYRVPMFAQTTLPEGETGT